MKLSEWARKNGIRYKTAHEWFRKGKMPCRAEQVPSGTILVYENLDDKKKKQFVIVYARVSSVERKNCLDGQVERCVSFANARGLQVNSAIKEIASGINDKRPKLMKIFDLEPTHIIVENKDRLTRFGFNYIEKLLSKMNCEILVLSRDEEEKTDLLKDLVSVITSFCCRLYGLRRGKNKAQKLKEEIACE